MDGWDGIDGMDYRGKGMMVCQHRTQGIFAHNK